MDKRPSDYISPQDLIVAKRIFDDIRREFPVKEVIEYEEKLVQIVHKHIWDVLAVLGEVYEQEADYVLCLQEEQMKSVGEGI